jgi:hypothetical protein
VTQDRGIGHETGGAAVHASHDPAGPAQDAGPALARVQPSRDHRVALRIRQPTVVELDPDNHRRAVSALARLLADHLAAEQFGAEYPVSTTGQAPDSPERRAA